MSPTGFHVDWDHACGSSLSSSELNELSRTAKRIPGCLWLVMSPILQRLNKTKNRRSSSAHIIMISLENDNGGSERKRETGAVIEYTRDETDTNQMMPPTRLESAATSASEWPDFTGAAAKSPTRQSRPDDLFSMLMMEQSDKESSPAPQSSESSGQSSADSSRPPVGSRSYSRELLSMFLDQATSNEEEALTYAMKQPELSPCTRHENDARKKKSTRKKKRDGSSSRSKHTILEDDWSDWRKTNKAIDSMLKSPVLSLSTGDTTPRSNNVARLPVIVSPSVTTTPSSFGGPRSLGPQDAVSVHSDLTSCFMPSDHLSNKSHEMQTLAKEKEMQKLAKEKEERELDAIAEKARILSLVRQPKPKKTVRFDSVQVRKYQRILSCNPSCTAGPPVGLGWKYMPSQNVRYQSIQDAPAPPATSSSPTIYVTSRTRGLAERSRIYGQRLGHGCATVHQDEKPTKANCNQLGSSKG